MSKRFELALYELARDHGSPVEVSVFERVLGITITGLKKATPENQRQTWHRFQGWCKALGLEIGKVIERDEPVVITYDPQKALELVELHKARRLHRRLSQVGATQDHMKQRETMQNSAEPVRDRVAPPMDGVLDSKGLAKELLISVDEARAIMRSGELQVFPACLGGGGTRTTRLWVYEWIEKQAAKGRGAR